MSYIAKKYRQYSRSFSVVDLSHELLIEITSRDMSEIRTYCRVKFGLRRLKNLTLEQFSKAVEFGLR